MDIIKNEMKICNFFKDFQLNVNKEYFEVNIWNKLDANMFNLSNRQNFKYYEDETVFAVK